VLSGESAVIRKRKARKRHRRLEPDEEARLLSVAGPHLQRVIICAVETSAREGEILSLQWNQVSLSRREIFLPAEKTKTKTDRTIPISDRLLGVLEMICNDPDGKPHKPSAFVFGNEVGQQVKNIKRAWQTAVLKAHGHEPTWTWTKKNTRKGSGSPSLESRQAYRAIDLHFHDLRHEAGSRLLEAGWPLHEVQQMLGHANIQQTSTYLNATLMGLHRSMKRLNRSRKAKARRTAKSSPACNPLANTPACEPQAAGKGTPAVDANSLVN
jgi:integrase